MLTLISHETGVKLQNVNNYAVNISNFIVLNNKILKQPIATQCRKYREIEQM